jgi:transposase
MKTSKPAHRKRSQRDYTMGFKLSVVEQVEKGQLTYKQAQKRYGIQGRSTVLVWLRKHGTLDWSSSGGRVMSHKETPEQRLKRLEKELQDAKDLNYLQHEMLKEIDRITGSSLEKKYLSERQKLRKRRGD